MFRSKVSIPASALALVLAAGCDPSGAGDVQTEVVQSALTPTNPAYINAGGQASGVWQADAFFTGGHNGTKGTKAIDVTGIASPAPQDVYQTAHIGTTTYNIGPFYTNMDAFVTLHFAETYHTGTGQKGARTFNVDINGTNVLKSFDVWATASTMAPVHTPPDGSNKAVVRTFSTTTDANGFIKIVFTTVADNAMISGIYISTSVPKLGSPNGSSCSSNNACASGFCIGGTCCESACKGLCDTGLSCDSTGTCAHKNPGTLCNTIKGSNPGYNDFQLFCSGGSCVGPTFSCGNTGVSCTADGNTACCQRPIVMNGTTTWTQTQCGAANTCAGNYGENCRSNKDCPTNQFCCFDGGYGFGWSTCHTTACPAMRQECLTNADCSKVPNTMCQNYNGTDFTCF